MDRGNLIARRQVERMPEESTRLGSQDSDGMVLTEEKTSTQLRAARCFAVIRTRPHERGGDRLVVVEFLGTRREFPIDGSLKPIVENRYPSGGWLPGPTEMVSLQSARGPARHFSASVSPLRPVMRMRSNDPVIAAKPVAEMIASSGYSVPLTSMPRDVNRSIGVFDTSTSFTWGRL